MERRYLVKDLIDALEHADQNKIPIYAGQGPCGGCDLVFGEPKKVDHRGLIKKLKGMSPLQPFYPHIHGPCGGCDICITPK